MIVLSVFIYLLKKLSLLNVNNKTSTAQLQTLKAMIHYILCVQMCVDDNMELQLQLLLLLIII